jgi:hypothetical protein
MEFRDPRPHRSGHRDPHPGTIQSLLSDGHAAIPTPPSGRRGRADQTPGPMHRFTRHPESYDQFGSFGLFKSELGARRMSTERVTLIPRCAECREGWLPGDEKRWKRLPRHRQSAGGERREALDQRLGMHRLPDGEVALELNVVVRSRERVWPCCGVDDPAVDDLDEALATSQVVSEGGGRGRCVGSYSHFAAWWFRSGHESS